MYVLLQAVDRAKEMILSLNEAKLVVEVFEAGGHGKVR